MDGLKYFMTLVTSRSNLAYLSPTSEYAGGVHVPTIALWVNEWANILSDCCVTSYVINDGLTPLVTTAL